MGLVLFRAKQQKSTACTIQVIAAADAAQISVVNFTVLLVYVSRYNARFFEQRKGLVCQEADETKLVTVQEKRWWSWETTGKPNKSYERETKWLQV